MSRSQHFLDDSDIVVSVKLHNCDLDAKLVRAKLNISLMSCTVLSANDRQPVLPASINALKSRISHVYILDHGIKTIILIVYKNVASS